MVGAGVDEAGARTTVVLFTEWRSAVELQSASTRTDGPGSTTRRRTLWSTYDQLKLNLAGLAARRVTLWSCWAPRVPRLQVSRGATELLVSYRTDPPTRQVRTKGRRLMCRIRRARGLLNCRSGSGGGSGMQRRHSHTRETRPREAYTFRGCSSARLHRRGAPCTYTEERFAPCAGTWAGPHTRKRGRTRLC